jgi:hypothetical protein
LSNGCCNGFVAGLGLRRFDPRFSLIATLEYVCKESRHANEKWWIPKEHIAIWDMEHDLAIQHYIDKFQFYVKAWLASPAGVAFNSEMARRK